MVVPEQRCEREDGAHVAWWYCPYAQCTASAGGAEKRQCEKGTAVECSRFARGRYVRWDNGINPKGSKAKFKSSMTVNEIKSKIERQSTSKERKNYKILLEKLKSTYDEWEKFDSETYKNRSSTISNQNAPRS